MSFNESIVENAALEWFGDLGYAVGNGPQLAPGKYADGTLTPALSHGERESFLDVVLVGRLRSCRRIVPFTGCYAMACRSSIPGPMAASRAIESVWVVGWFLFKKS